jgi:hypothetical protein
MSNSENNGKIFIEIVLSAMLWQQRDCRGNVAHCFARHLRKLCQKPGIGNNMPCIGENRAETHNRMTDVVKNPAAHTRHKSIAAWTHE